jgi:hypothetical protein
MNDDDLKDQLPLELPEQSSGQEQPALFDVPQDWRKHWTDMPEFEQRNLMPWQSVKVHFRNLQDRQAFSRLVGQTITDLTPSVWFPKEERKRLSFDCIKHERKQPRYPVFIPSKSRSNTRFTVKAFEAIGTPYKIFVEPQEYAEYASVIDPANIVTLPFSNRGLVATRNYIWGFALSLETPRFWTFDDNIKGFMWLTNNEKIRVTDGAMFALIEDFADRYENVVIAGCNYQFFAKNKQAIPPYILNTRIYSNMLIQTNARNRKGESYRNEGFYNDDTDLCLRVLKDGFCTVQFNSFLIDKATTMSVQGGMTEHYLGDGRYKMAKELADKHPDVVTITEKFGRWQHQVNYEPFKNNKLILKASREDI